MKKRSESKSAKKSDTLFAKSMIAFLFAFIVPLLLALLLIYGFLNEKTFITSSINIKVIVGLMIVSGIIGGSAIRSIIGGITGLTKQLKDLSMAASGDDMDESHGNELKDLALAFNRMTKDLEKRVEDLQSSKSLTRELFQKIGYAIASTHKNDELFKLIVQTMRKVLQAEGAFLGLYDDERESFTLKYYAGSQKDIHDNMKIPDDRGVIGFSIKGAKPMVIKKGGSEHINVDPDEEFLEYTNILVVPIMEKGNVLGVVGVSNLKSTDRIATDDLFLLENVAGQVSIAIKNLELNKNVEDTYFQTLLTLARAVEAKDTYSAGHLERVSEYALAIADKLGLNEAAQKVLAGGAILHDLGKVGIRDDILKKEGKLTEEEYTVMKEHSVIGENILKPLRSMSKLAELVRCHHEAYDGSGYPDGLVGEEISVVARILSVADIYDAVSTDRPYRKGMSKTESIKVLRDNSGTKLDPKLVEIFISYLREKEREESLETENELEN